MITSSWRCPRCKSQLLITNSAEYWCSACQKFVPASHADPLDRDWQRVNIRVQYAVEKEVNKVAESA